MHCNNVVVALVDDNKKPIREHEPKKLGSSPLHREKGISPGRSCRVLMPFDTEFKILIKNKNDCRVSLDIEIDGATVSRNGLILGAHETHYIERSVDVAHKFKFVPSDHEDVADPDNLENGNVVVRVWKEKDNSYDIYKYQPPAQPRRLWDPPYNPWGTPYTPYWCNNKVTYNDKSANVGGSVHDNSMPTKGSSAENYNSILRNVVFLSADVGDSGAVIDGDHSSQTFGTTHWNGNDGPETKFVFYIRGTNQEIREKEEAELEELDRLMKKYSVFI